MVPEFGQIFVNFAAEDAEHFLVNNPNIFQSLVDRHQNILQPFGGPIGNNDNDERASESDIDGDGNDDDDDDDDEDENNGNNDDDISMDNDADHFEIQHLGIDLQVDRHRIRLASMPVEAMETANELPMDVFHIPHHGLSININTDAVVFTNMEN